ncbi:hypothetical protein CHLNCDRAFT_144528 [Chlorella variabilis]|uniref:Major facilitator superfamily (MFS) profile domain-containing protein n=1 Tax=Chlorella variabilis TaxID=554065 RepID=E1ZBM1_CHLVA|nr:hypothetical protein CHLNCDRAFT_144528 [Chlorella variabilis]EFN56879.1 hypothetical protein CHLNCDRAFT_144528 [Chlorella variabilis]|eukprot:XP_005848981.1 hypothetical protein CHLNCDRAFT_144528 [Chlorella variabilis]
MSLQPVEEPPKRRSTLLTVCPFILGNEFCERLAFYGLSTNLIIYLTRVMGEDNGFAAIQLNLFEGTCYLTPLLGAWLADSMWGRYKTIIVFSVIYFLGMVLLAVSAALPGLTPTPDKYASPLQNAVLYGSLYIIALGTGGIKPNVSAFGADQFDEADPQDRREKTSFFNWFYFFVNIGSLLAVTVIVWVQENISWAVGFAVPAAVMACAILTFVAGSPLYTHMGSFFVAQGVKMDSAIGLPGGGAFIIPAASLAAINTVAIVVLIPIYDKLLVPAMRRLGRTITLLQRIGWGLVVCVASMLMAGYVEYHRLSLCNEGTWQPDGSDGGGAGIGGWLLGGLRGGGGGANKHDECLQAMSVWWQVPQYLLVGLSEGRLDLFFLCLAALMALNLLIFLWVAARYEYKAVEHVKRVVLPRSLQRPPRPPPFPPRSQPVDSLGASRAHPQAVPGAAGVASSPAPSIFSRSVTFMPKSPAMPAPMR